MEKKMERMATDIKIWSKTLFSEAKVQFHFPCKVILWLDVAQENRRLSQSEFLLRKQLKMRTLGLAAVERARNARLLGSPGLELETHT